MPLCSRPKKVPQARRGSRTTSAPTPAAQMRVLADIDNFVHGHILDSNKIQLPTRINCPITRSVGTQLLKKAQADPCKANDARGKREPWHDLHMKIDGPTTCDVMQNYWSKASKCHGNTEEYPLNIQEMNP